MGGEGTENLTCPEKDLQLVNFILDEMRLGLCSNNHEIRIWYCFLTGLCFPYQFGYLCGDGG